MVLQELRDAVRRQLEIDELDLPNDQVDIYIREAFTRTIQVEDAWPFFETDWEFTVAAGSSSHPLPSDVNAVASARRDGFRGRLQYISHEMAEDSLPLGSGTPKFFSVWGEQMYLWPRPDADVDVVLRGWRKPRNWVSEGAGGVIDADERLHLPLIYYACGLYKAFEEDEVLEQTYTSRWASGVSEARGAIMRPDHHRPLVLSGGLRANVPRVPFIWNAP